MPTKADLQRYILIGVGSLISCIGLLLAAIKATESEPVQNMIRMQTSAAGLSGRSSFLACRR